MSILVAAVLGRNAGSRRRDLARAAWTAGFVLAATHLCAGEAAAAEMCRYSGTTDYDGRVAVTTTVAAAGDVTTVNVAMTFEATTMLWFHLRYLVEEVSTWRGGELESVAMNTRYLVGSRIVRQLWDDFQRGPDGLAGFRVQSKTLAEFRIKHPGFVAHWDPATFGRPWRADYGAAAPERRADLDLARANLPAGLRSPLAAAFYWVRWLPFGSRAMPVFLPGWKADRRLDLAITAAPWSGGTLLRAPLRHPALRERPASTATAWISPDRGLLQLAFDLHASNGSAQGVVKQDGCSGAPVVPAEWRR